MAKIDTTKIEGFDAMSADEKVAALLAYEEPQKDENAEITKYKNLVSKANAEAARYKDELRAKQTEAERAEAERQEHDKAIMDELAGYKERERIATYKANLMSAGIDEKSAEVMARSLPDGVKQEYFDAVKTSIEVKMQAAEIAALNKQPPLSVGTPPSPADPDDKQLRAWMGL